MARTLAIDYGKRRIGLAISDPLGMIAQPLDTLEVKNPRAAIPTLKQLASDNEVGEVVVGWPISDDGGATTIATEVEAWAGSLAKALTCPVVLQDERFSSQWADRVLAETGEGKKDRGQRDRLAAQAILEDHLAKKRISG